MTIFKSKCCNKTAVPTSALVFITLLCQAETEQVCQTKKKCHRAVSSIFSCNGQTGSFYEPPSNTS